MGFIDSDTHVSENEHTWDFFDPSEREYAPRLVDGRWLLPDNRPVGAPFDPDRPEKYYELHPRGSVDLTDPTARIRRMDELGVDVHVIFSTWWIGNDLTPPIVEAAYARSYNRWMAERTADSGGRLRWALHVPLLMPERAFEEMEFGKEHGAVAVNLRGVRHGLGLSHPSYFPLYEKAQDLDLAIAVHVGGDSRVFAEQQSLVFVNNIAPVAGAFFTTIIAQLPEQFPRVRWACLEAGASWLPFVFQEALRSDRSERGAVGRNFRNWKAEAVDILAKYDVYVACQIDDDLPYLSQFFRGTERLVFGTDYVHMDVGADPYGHLTILTQSGLPIEEARGIVDGNGRRLYGIDPSFTPAPASSYSEPPQLELVPNAMGGSQAPAKV